MKKIYVILAFFLLTCVSSVWSTDKRLYLIKTQLETPDFFLSSYPNLDGWYLRDLEISRTFTSGFRIEVKLSTSSNVPNGTILRLGVFYGSSNEFHSGYALFCRNSTLTTERMIVLEGNRAKKIIYDAWDKNILEANKDYTVIFEIDETRLRVTTLKEHDPEKERVEYEFNGLSSSYLKDILTGYAAADFQTIGFIN